MIPGHGFTTEDARPGPPAVHTLECQCGQVIVTAASTGADARRRARRVFRHHAGFAAAAGTARP